MTSTAAVSSTNGVNPGSATPPASALPLPADSLLVLPAEGTDTSDPLATIYLLQSKDRDLALQKGKTDVAARDKAREEAIKQEIEQLKKAAEAAQHHDFWDDLGRVCITIAKVAAVVGSVAIAVVSCGAGTAVAALAIVGCLMSTAGFAEGEFHVLEKAGVDSKTAGFVGLGLSIGGLAANFAAGLASAGTVASATEQVVATTGRVATCASATAHIAGGAAKIVASHYGADSEERGADAFAAQRTSFFLQRQIQALIDTLADDDKASHRRLGYVQGAIEANDAALDAAVITRA